MNENIHIHADTGTLTLQTLQKASAFNKWMYETIKPFLYGEVLEIGSGLGNISQYVIQDNFNLTLSDINTEYCEILTDTFRHCPTMKGILMIDLQHPDFFTQYKELKEKFDSVFLLNVIEHLENDSQAILNCHFILKKGGNLIVLAPAYPFLYCRFDKELGHYRRYTSKSLSSVFKNSLFSIFYHRYFNFAGIPGWLFFGKMLKKKMIGKTEMSAFEKLVPLFKIIDRFFLNKTGLSIIVTGKKK